jgi:hypothetical protein
MIQKVRQTSELSSVREEAGVALLGQEEEDFTSEGIVLNVF